MQNWAMKVQARLSESGQLVQAAEDEDWALVHPPDGQPRPILFCPERICDNRVTAVEIVNPAGRTTRFFRFVPHGPTCGHQEVSDPVIVEPPTIAQPGESAEHRWLKEYVRQAALDVGHHGVRLEATLADQVRADVFVPGVVRGRIEVQRGPTNVPERTEGFAEVVWLLRAAFNETNRRYLFTCPCVQVRVVRRVAERWVLAEPWLDGWDAEVRATATVLQARADPDPSDPYGFFETAKNVPLAAFLSQVWSGHRRWHPQLTAHRFAGWITDEDWERYESWRQPAPSPAPEEEAVPGPEAVPVLTEPPPFMPIATPAPDRVPAEVERPARMNWHSRLWRWLFGPR